MPFTNSSRSLNTHTNLVCLFGFTYLQTGSGKTYTMIGGKSEEERGILPRAFLDLFRIASERTNEEFSVRVR